jgi:hypothetical protein
MDHFDSPKHRVRELLALLASEDDQLAYERDVPIAQVPAELLCMWFNDTYHPGPDWSSHFTNRELEALARFHGIYERLSERLPKSPSTVRTWLADPLWRRIMAEAAATLVELS